MKINNVEFDFDVYELDNFRKLEEGFEEIDRVEKDFDGAKAWQKMEAYSEAVVNFFYDLFGKEITEQIFTTKTNFLLISEALLELAEQTRKVIKNNNAKFEKYSPDRFKRG